MKRPATKNRKQAMPIKAFKAMPEDIRLLNELRAKLEPEQGSVSDSTLLRMGIRALAEAKGINAVQP
jgi:hypothetical protein